MFKYFSKRCKKKDKILNSNLYKQSDIKFVTPNINEIVKENINGFNFLIYETHSKKIKFNKKIYLDYKLIYMIKNLSFYYFCT